MLKWEISNYQHSRFQMALIFLKERKNQLKTNLQTEPKHTQSVPGESENMSATDSIIISALFHALVLENSDKYHGPDALVVNRLNNLFPNQRGLAQATIAKRLAVGRRKLKISKKNDRKTDQR